MLLTAQRDVVCGGVVAWGLKHLTQISLSGGGKWCLAAFNCIMFFVFLKLQ